jgi:NADH:ubiquinone oxidoreductase subunit 2 (subunit N)
MNITLINTKIFYLDFFYEYGLGILFINICVYLLLLSIIFGVFFFFDLKNFRTLNELKGLNSYNFLLMLSALALLSLAGMPPLLGFVGKFILLIFLAYKNQFLLFFMFSVINLFMIYFYIQNVRFMVKKSTSRIILIKNYYINLDFRLVFVLSVLNFLNIFGICIFEDFLIIFNY